MRDEKAAGEPEVDDGPKHFAATPPDPPPARPEPQPKGPAYIPYVTIALVAANVIVWIATIAYGAHPMSPTPEWMFAHGGNAGAVTLDGEEWRIGTSMFLHYGILHLALNMIGLVGGGRLVEQLFGRVGFAAVYLTAGLGSGLATALRTGVVSAGASGAIFGVLGALGAYYLLHRDRMDRDLATQAGGLLAFLAYNVVYGFSQPNVDVLAHLGGLGVGFLVGLALAYLRPRGVPTFIVAVVATFVVVAGIAFAPAPIDKDRKAFQELGAVEERVLARWNELVPKVRAQQIKDDELADVLEKDILPPWRAAVEAFEKSGAGDPKLRPKMLEYLRRRQIAWETMADGLRKGDGELVERGAKLFQDTEQLIRSLEAN